MDTAITGVAPVPPEPVPALDHDGGNALAPRIGFAMVRNDFTRDPAVSLKLKGVFAIIAGRVGKSDAYPITNATLLKDTGIKSRTTLSKYCAALEAVAWVERTEGTRRWHGREIAATCYALPVAARPEYNGHFARVWHPIARDPRLSLEARGLYTVLAGHAGARATCFLSVRTLEAETGSGSDTLARCREELVHAGVVREGLSMQHGCLTFTLCAQAVREDFDPTCVPARPKRPMDAQTRIRLATRRDHDRKDIP